ncbi:hypothetical protein J6590_041867 [Homalodisca vitripennis]|nr:hypothetical protein J6590_041867 [Homalodisca vitripennis]
MTPGNITNSNSRLDLSNYPFPCFPDLSDESVFAVPCVSSTGRYKTARREPSWECNSTLVEEGRAEVRYPESQAVSVDPVDEIQLSLIGCNKKARTRSGNTRCARMEIQLLKEEKDCLWGEYITDAPTGEDEQDLSPPRAFYFKINDRLIPRCLCILNYYYDKPWMKKEVWMKK